MAEQLQVRKKPKGTWVWRIVDDQGDEVECSYLEFYFESHAVEDGRTYMDNPAREWQGVQSTRVVEPPEDAPDTSAKGG